LCCRLSSQVCEELGKLGLGQYVATFTDAQYDGAALVEADDTALTALGVSIKMHRNAIMRMREDLM